MQTGKNLRACYRRPSAIMANLAAAAVLVALVTSGALVRAQKLTPVTIPPGSQAVPPAQNPALKQTPNAAKPSPSTPAPTAAQMPAPEPPKPDWPVNNKPVPAKVTWDVHGLTVEANNSSLDEILKEVAAVTGARLEGKVGDDRVFGSYGPGSARDVITQLLDGTSYNVLMAGDLGEGTPKEIVLSNRPTGPAPANNAQNNSEDDVEYEQPPQPVPGIPPVRNAYGPPGMPPEQNQQQMEERRAEIEQRMQQMREQQQEQQQQQQQPNPQF
ncbi:MAG: hypothetical protein WAL75_14430 [Terracidiphilus sp.]